MAISSGDFDYICRLVRENSAIVLTTGKEYLAETRLTPVARDEGFAGLEQLIAQLRKTTTLNGLHRKAIEALTTNETSFFRDIHPFDALKKIVLPEFFGKRGGKPLHIWSGASSSGQEAYSIAMLVRDSFPSNASNVKIIGTDLSSEMVNRCKTGKYSQLEVNRGLPANLLVKNFDRQGMDWIIKPELRAMVDFRELNLISNWVALPQFDIVFMRNVLIYFNVDTKRAILGKIRRVLAPDGYLFLGCAETTFNVDDSYERAVMDKAIAYRQKA